MNEVEILQDLLESARKISYSNKDDFNVIQQRAEMYARKFFGNDSHYISDLRSIGYSPTMFISGGTTNWAYYFEKGLKEFKDIITIMIEDKKLNSGNENKKPSTFNKKETTSEIFIVHGHDEEAQSKVARFIEKLGLKPIILHEQASSGNTIIEKIEEYSNVGFGIVLYTPCDIGGKQTSSPDLKSRARQNVVFEHGFLIGKIGRDKVCALVKGDIETPNDISGVVYVSMDTSAAWQIKIAKELRRAGYEFDANILL